MKKVRVHLMIYGDVTGVGYRYWARENAIELGLKGFVRNTESGMVEAVFEGEEEKIDKIIEMCKKGPEVAWVEKVQVSREDYKGEFSSFEVRF